MTGGDTLATILILTSAFLHALWNAGVKSAPDKFAAMVFISGWGGFLFLPFVPLAPMPEPDLWLWIVGSLAIHLCYQQLLAKALEAGDLTVSYPIARGMGPMLVAIVSYFFLAGEISTGGLFGVAVLVGGIFTTAGASRRQSTDPAQFRKSLVYALGAGCMIASYTLVDGLAVRRTADPLTYVLWSGIAFMPVLMGYAAWRRGPDFLMQSLAWWRRGLPLSILAQVGYGFALYAYSLGSLGEIAALRECSIIFASLIGFLWLKESFSLRKGVAVLMIAIGAILLKSF
ncbi:MAG: hypothetical protein EP335_04460 [Alphaproteobacteria bacterium]|nr:MAG: hypothetical protein EP335_04460 [Alphaproteobacteria bacterium]